MIKEKKLLFSLTAKDFTFETFCTGGNGGQHRNAKKNGVRCRHTASGAVAEHRDGRDQRKNKEAAFEKCCKSKVFTQWHKAEVARRMQTEEQKYLERIVKEQVQERVSEQMAERNLRVEVYDPITNTKMP